MQTLIQLSSVPCEEKGIGLWVHVCVYGLLSSASALELLLDTVLLWMLLRLPPNISASRAGA